MLPTLSASLRPSAAFLLLLLYCFSFHLCLSINHSFGYSVCFLPATGNRWRRKRSRPVAQAARGRGGKENVGDGGVGFRKESLYLLRQRPCGGDCSPRRAGLWHPNGALIDSCRNALSGLHSFYSLSVLFLHTLFSLNIGFPGVDFAGRDADTGAVVPSGRPAGSASVLHIICG